MRGLVYVAVIVIIIFLLEQHATVYEIQLYCIHICRLKGTTSLLQAL